MGKHSEETTIHVIHTGSYATAAARQAATLTSDDIGKIYKQTDTGQFFMLVATDPVWVEIVAAGLEAYRNVATHTDTTWYSLYTDGDSEQILIPSDTIYALDIMVVGLTSGAAQRWVYTIVGAAALNDGGTTTILAAGTKTAVSESDAAYDVQLVADDTNDAVEIQVRRNGGSDYDINWSATVRIAPVTY